MRKLCSFLVMLGMCLGITVSVEAANIPSKAMILAQEKALQKMVNEERKKHGLAPVEEWNVLKYYARQHSRDMAKNKVAFGHTGFKDRAQAVQNHTRCDIVGENLAYTYLYKDPLEKSVEMWMKSPGHRENLLGDYTEGSIGIVYNEEGYCYITQMFSKISKKN